MAKEVEPKILALAEALFSTLVFLLVNVRSFIFWRLYPPTEGINQAGWYEIYLWIFTLILMVYLLIRHDLAKTYWIVLRKYSLLIIFVLFSLSSVLWSSAWTVTLHRSLTFAFATLAAVYFGTRYSINRLLQLLSGLGFILMLISFLLIFAIPVLGTDLNPPYNGAWRGVYWHKNHLGNIMPIFSLVYLIQFINLKFKNSHYEKAIYAILYLVSLILVIYSKSVSGYILVLITHIILGLAFLWLKLRYRLQAIHYLFLSVVFIVGVVVATLNLELILGLFNRTPTFTGRVPMWSVLLQNVFPQKPLIGYGFGTIWADAGFRIEIRDEVGWTYPVLIGDNGFLDILLNLGIIGLGLFLLNYIKAWIESVRCFLRGINLGSFFPFTFLVYTLFANLTFSLFMETEVFVWTLIVTLMICSTRENQEAI